MRKLPTIQGHQLMSVRDLVGLWVMLRVMIRGCNRIHARQEFNQLLRLMNQDGQMLGADPTGLEPVVNGYQWHGMAIAVAIQAGGLDSGQRIISSLGKNYAALRRAGRRGAPR